MVRPFYAGQNPDLALVSAKNFREDMEKRVIADEASLRDAIAKTQAEMRKLEIYLSGLDIGRHELWGTQVQSEISALGKLIQKWESQLAHLKVQETQARTWRWQQDKAKEEARRYLASKETALAEGKKRTEAIKALRDASEELENAFSLCQMITSKAEVQQMPDLIPVGKVGVGIAKFEAILEGLRDRLPEADIRQATRDLNRIKQQQMEMRSVLARLGYSKEVAGYEAKQASEGLRYFQTKLPSEIREMLSPRTVTGLEDLASKGLGAAKDAIVEAIKMAAKQSPERVRAILGG